MDQRQRAIYWLDRRAYGRAEHELGQWVLSHPDDLYAHMELIWCFYKREVNSRRWARCNEFYDDVYKQPNQPLLKVFVRAEQMVYDDNEDEAVQLYLSVIEGGLDVPTVRHSLAVALENTERYQEAQKEYEDVLSIDPYFLPTLHGYSKWLFEEGRFDRLETLVEQLCEKPDDVFELVFTDAVKDIAYLQSLKKTVEGLKRAISLYKENKIQEAALSLWPMFRTHKNNCSFIRTMVFLFYRNDWLVSAKDRLRDVLGDEGSFARYAEGLVLWYEDKYEEALTAYTEAIEKGLDHPLVHCARALVLEKLERSTEEEDDLLKAHAHQPWLAYARSELAFNAIERSDYARVIGLAELNQTDRKCTLLYDISGRAYLAELERLALKSLIKQGNITEALSRVEHDISPIGDEDLLFQRAMVYAEAGKLDRAADELSASIKVDDAVLPRANREDMARISAILQNCPDSYGACLAHGLFPAYEENFKEARERLLELAVRFPNESRIWYHIGSLSFLLDDKLNAKEAFRRAMSLDTSNNDALRELCRISRAAEDLQGLRDLADELKDKTLPLLFALRLLREQEKHELANDIAQQILSRDPDHTEALWYLLQKRDDVMSLDYTRMFERITKLHPFDFKGRSMIARTFLRNSLPAESLERYGSLLSDGVDSVHCALLYGISRIAMDLRCSDTM